MILQQLARDADRLVGNLPPPMYDVKPVKWVVYLNGDGTAQWPPQPTSGGEGKKDRGKARLVPFKGRTVAIQPLLLADKVTYTWGMPADHKRAAQEHAAYLDLLDRCAAGTENRDVALVARFLREWDPERQPLPEEMLPDQLTTFAVEERFPIDDPAVRRFWAAEVGGGEEGSGTAGQCLVCGLQTQLVERLPVPLKGIPNGQASGVHLVSANASAFESYGRSAALTSPVCQSCGERFGKAANALLVGEKTRVRVGPVVYIFWAPEQETDWLVDLFNNPQPEEVKALFESPKSGKPVDTVGDQSFFATSLSAAISRVVVRSWLHSTLPALRSNIRRWFEWQRVTNVDGTEGYPLSVRRLARCIYLDDQKVDQKIAARVPDALFQSALNGAPLPTDLLAQAVRRNQAERQVTYPRAALIKAVLCSQGMRGDMEQLDLSNRDPAYLCGRLLAELEAIQRVAINPKATLVDRYYGTASTAPASIFGTLLRGAQPHLSMLRKNRGGAYTAFQERLEEIMRDLSGWPTTLKLHEQAVFALGYYHQRAENRRLARAARERRLGAADAPLELADDADTFKTTGEDHE